MPSSALLRQGPARAVNDDFDRNRKSRVEGRVASGTGLRSWATPPASSAAKLGLVHSLFVRWPPSSVRRRQRLDGHSTSWLSGRGRRACAKGSRSARCGGG